MEQRIKDEINEGLAKEGWIETLQDSAAGSHNKLAEAHQKLRVRVKQLTVRSKEHEAKIDEIFQEREAPEMPDIDKLTQGHEDLANEVKEIQAQQAQHTQWTDWIQEREY